MRQYLFAYGTLQPRLAPPAITAVVRRLRPVGRGRVGGSLYDLGEYPGATFDADDWFVYGRVFRLPGGGIEAADLLRQIDRYEGVDPADPAAGLYHRLRVSVRLRSGRRLTCWAYACNGPVEANRRVPSGRYIGPKER